MSTRTERPWLNILLGCLCVVAIVVAYTSVGQASSPASGASRLVRVQSGVVQSTVSGSGNIQAASQLNLGFKTAGTVTQIYVTQGQHVTEGQLLATLDPQSAEVTLEQAKASLLSAEANLAKEEETDGETSGQSSAGQGAGGTGAASAATASTASVRRPARLQTLAVATVQTTTASPAQSSDSQEPSTAAPNTSAPDTAPASTSVPSQTTTTTVTTTESASPKQPAHKEHLSTPTHKSASATERQAGTSEGSAASSSSDGSHSTSSSSSVSSATREANLASARAAVKSEKLTVQSDERAVQNTKLYAPESGTIVSLSGQVGETVSGAGTTKASSTSGSSGESATGSSVAGRGTGAGGSSAASSSGDSSSSSSAFAVLSDLSSMKLVVPLSESEVGSVSDGQIATVTVEALNGRKLAATVSEVSTLATSNSGVVSYDVTFELEQLEAGLKPGMSATAEVVVKQAEGLNVPTSAISGGEVTVVRNGVHVRQRVVTGLAGNSSTIILSGLKAGEEVALPVATSTGSSLTGRGTSALGRAGGLGGAGLGAGGGGFVGGGGAAFFRGGG